jgi:hypothetical protein
VSIHGPGRLHFKSLKLLYVVLNADPDPAFHSNADPDPGSQNNADPDPQPCLVALISQGLIVDTLKLKVETVFDRLALRRLCLALTSVAEKRWLCRQRYRYRSMRYITNLPHVPIYTKLQVPKLSTVDVLYLSKCALCRRQ